MHSSDTSVAILLPDKALADLLFRDQMLDIFSNAIILSKAMSL